MGLLESLGLYRAPKPKQQAATAEKKPAASTAKAHWNTGNVKVAVADLQAKRPVGQVLPSKAVQPRAAVVDFNQLAENVTRAPLTKDQRARIQQGATLVARSIDRREANLDTLKRMDLAPELLNHLLLETFFAKYPALRTKAGTVASAKAIASAPVTTPEGRARVTFEQDLLRPADEGTNLALLPVQEVGRHVDASGTATDVNEMKLVGDVNRQQQTITVFHDPTTNEVWFSEKREDRDWSSVSAGISPRDVSERGLKNVVQALSTWAASHPEGDVSAEWSQYLLSSVIPQIESHVNETKTNQLKRAILAATG